jgi:hypothetical protein
VIHCNSLRDTQPEPRPLTDGLGCKEGLLPVTAQYDADSSQIYSLGAKVDKDKIFFSAELAQRLIHGVAFSRANGGYLAAGYRFGKWLPLLTYSGSWDIQGAFNFHPNYPTDTSVLRGSRGWTGTLGFTASDSVTVNAEYNTTEVRYSSASSNFSFQAIKAGVDYVF